MLQEFLVANRLQILEISAEKTKALAGSREDSEQLRRGLPLFYEQLIRVLAEKKSARPSVDLLNCASEHGKEFLRLGYSLSHVVHAYGAMCQAITELAIMKNAMITAVEFNVLNGCLDTAIAAAVSEFQFHSVQASETRETEHLGFLAHELRNALSSATIAHEMIKAGLVGTGGSTSAVLESNLTRMRHLIDRSLSEVRTRADVQLFVEKFRIAELIDQIILTANVDAKKRNQTVSSQVDRQLTVESDRQFILSAVANLLQNAIKYTKTGGSIQLRAQASGDKVTIEVEDECGGIPADKVDSIFEPFVQINKNKSGLG